MRVTLAELAERFGCVLHGPPERTVSTVGTLTGAGPDAVAFFANPAYAQALSETRAGAVILDERAREQCPVPCLVTPNPYATYARVAALLHPAPPPAPGVHPSAVVAPDAKVAPSAEIGPHAVVGPRSEIGDGVVIGPGCTIGADVKIGAHTRLVARVVVLDRVRVGSRCLFQPGAVIGGDGFGFAEDFAHGGWVKVPQLGTVVIGDDVEVGANTTIDRGAIEDTVIEDGVKLDNLVMIAHNVRVGAHTVMAAMTGVAGSTRIGKRCMIGGSVGITGHISICDDVAIQGKSFVAQSIDKPGLYGGGALPADEAARWRRNAARFRQLDELAKRVRALEKSAKEKPESER
ncbi:MAG: UDP-3-O-(3-hydroxymyristoyl)glucosamine N-acyltransferase [Gammaproteobacteria bacterium]|nr:UDP-3-O-(3-hydroxymyristoyl)glucosamine N-acyltransferase [Gammaproteobacteria bacterium]